MRTTRLRSIVAVLSALLLLAGCGDGGVSADGDGAVAEAEDPAAEGEAVELDIPEELRRLTFVGGTDGSSANAWLIGATELFNQHLGLSTTVQSGDGTQNNLLLENGEITAGIANPVGMVEVTGNPDALEQTQVRTLWNMFQTALTVIVAPESDAEVLSDLEGARIAVGPGPETSLFNLAMECIDLTTDDFEFYNIGKEEAVAAYRDNQIEAMVGLGPTPTPQWVEAMGGRRGGRVIGVDAEIIDCLADTGLYVPSEIPAGSYEGQDEAIPSVEQWFYASVTEDFPEDLAYEMARVLDENHDDLVATFAGAERATAENTANAIGFALHPGTQRYLEEKGLLGN